MVTQRRPAPLVSAKGKLIYWLISDRLAKLCLSETERLERIKQLMEEI
tara:strand:- start:370 stop:513 length:144 start_codon:yes stop_codon:yes gene_type:complete